MRSAIVNNLRKAYAHRAKLRGQRKKSALPWSLGTVEALVAYLKQAIKEPSGLPLLLLHRDLLIVTLLWNTSSRGANAGSWRLENIKLPTGRVPSPLADFSP